MREFGQLSRFLLENNESSATIQAKFQESLTTNLDKDIAAGTTSTGPHRDDWHFQIDGHALAEYGSRGQQRTAILAYKLAETDQMRQETGEQPLLLLDDVIAELDQHRRGWLLEYIKDKGQIFITSTGP